MDRFVLLGRPRTGSTLLKSILNSIPRIYCAHELFNKVSIVDEAKKYPIKYLKKWYQEKNGNKIAKGFKLHYDHKQENVKRVWRYLIDDKKIKIIQIRRRNHLATLTSLIKAHETKKWTGFSEDVNEKFKINIPYVKCMRFFNEYTRLDSTYFEKFNDHPIIVVFYEDLLNNFNVEMNRIQSFLNTPQEKRTNICKVKKQNLSDEIENFEGLKERFKGSEWTSFFDE